MNKTLLAALVCCLLCLGVTQAAVGDSLFVGDTEVLSDNLISSPHQDDSYNVNWLVDFYNATNNLGSTLPYPLELLGKWEIDDVFPDYGTWDDGIDPGFTGDFLGDSGTWFAPAGFSDYLYFSIKTGSENSGGGFELYYVNYGAVSGVLSGAWNTVGLSSQDLSHISFWSAPASTPVPEPATMLLFGTGLAGIAAFARKRVSVKK